MLILLNRNDFGGRNRSDRAQEIVSLVFRDLASEVPIRQRLVIGHTRIIDGKQRVPQAAMRLLGC
ncbi:MAG TPA: hypothetical protein VN108_08890 [Marmoricola sp.]|nr:hypothetical protein [Marmoricola sp.]